MAFNFSFTASSILGAPTRQAVVATVIFGNREHGCYEILSNYYLHTLQTSEDGVSLADKKKFMDLTATKYTASHLPGYQSQFTHPITLLGASSSAGEVFAEKALPKQLVGVAFLIQTQQIPLFPEAFYEVTSDYSSGMTDQQMKIYIAHRKEIMTEKYGDDSIKFVKTASFRSQVFY